MSRHDIASNSDYEQSHTANMTGPFPAPQSTTPFWRTELDPIDELRTTDSLPAACDILIIGAGLSGASTAYHLVKDTTVASASIVVVDARQVCSGATGRNGGHVKLAWPWIISLAKDYGRENAAEVAQFHLSQIYAMKETIEKEKIDCDFALRRSYDVYLDKTESEYANVVSNHQLMAGVAVSKHVEFINKKYTEQLTRAKDSKAALSVPACSLWPYKLGAGLLSISIKKGVNLQTNTCVTSVAATRTADGYYLVNTSRGIIKARKILFASNGYTAGILPEYQDKIIPWRGINSRIVVGEDQIPPNLSNTYNLHNYPGTDEYINPRPDGSIIVGGAKTSYWHDKKQYYNNADDSTLIEPAKHYFDEYMQKYFLDYTGSGAYTDMIWTEIMGYTPDALPHIGAIPGRPDQFIMAGFNGAGMLHIFLSGKGIAQMLSNNVQFEETQIPRIFKTTQERLDDNKRVQSYINKVI
ncbi:FAD dependent oxidoreductase [Trichoderma velutinum]